MKHQIAVLGVVLLALGGCAHPMQQARLQSAEDGDRDKEADVKTIGDVTSVANAEPLAAFGVGLVVGLDGTGGGAPPGPYRVLLEDALKKSGVENVKEVLASRNVSLVLVAAQIPPGARKGDPLDVEITLPPQSQTRSLRGGTLRLCNLYQFDSRRNVSPDYAGPDALLRGHRIATAEGPVQVGLGAGDEEVKLREGRIWGGGRSLVSRPFYLVLNPDQQFARLASTIADRINETFHGPGQPDLVNALAVAKSRELVLLNVPQHYRLNLPRYLRVVRLIPLREELARLQENKLSPNGGPAAGDSNGNAYRRKLEQDLQDPARTIQAALRLEALGHASAPVLKKGLSSDHVLVRFAAAEALAYLGEPAGGEELARLVETQPALRAFSLTALASLNEAVSHVKLKELLRCSNPETRYGAFRALRVMNEHDEVVRGELINDSFWLHHVAENTPPLIHLSATRRAEVVLFGEAAELIPPFSILAGEFTVTAGQEDRQATVSRISVQHGRSRQQCPLRMDSLLDTLTQLGAQYPDVVELIRRLDECQALSCPVVFDALPQATSVYELVQAGRDGELPAAGQELLLARSDLGATPNLFEKDSPGRRSSRSRGTEAAARREPQPAALAR